MSLSYCKKFIAITKDSFNTTSIILIYAKADIFSCAIIHALYGMLITSTNTEKTDN